MRHSVSTDCYFSRVVQRPVRNVIDPAVRIVTSWQREGPELAVGIGAFKPGSSTRGRTELRPELALKSPGSLPGSHAISLPRPRRRGSIPCRRRWLPKTFQVTGTSSSMIRMAVSTMS
jgi:hypothetical protein